MRVLHVVGRMHRAGVETWLMYLLRNFGRQIQFDFLVHSHVPSEYDNEIRSLGGRIIPCTHPRNDPFLYTRRLRRILQSQGPYDVVHSHLREFSGWILTIAHRAGVPIRVAHCHNNLSQYYNQTRIHKLRMHVMRRLLNRHATLGLAASREAAASLYGACWEDDPRWRVLHYGVDLALFGSDPLPDRAEVRRELGIPADAFVVGHVGRFVKQKNQKFLIEIAAELVKREPAFRLLLIGEGETRPAVEGKVAEFGLSKWVIFAGSRADVPRLMKGAMDAFVLPSWWEGLPLVGIEAQAAGLPLLVSDCLTSEVNIVPDLVRRMPLALTASAWADALLAGRDNESRIDPRSAFDIVERTEFNVVNCSHSLLQLYENQ